MTQRDLAALRRSIWKGCRTVVEECVRPLGPHVQPDAWCDDDREWEGPEVVRESRRINRLAQAALRQAEKKMCHDEITRHVLEPSSEDATTVTFTRRK